MEREPSQGSEGGVDRSVMTALGDEVRRQRLIERLAERWNVRLVVVTAPAGYGKSTAVAQAVRDNAEDPSGIDVVVRATPLHASVDEVLDDVAARLGADGPTRRRPSDGSALAGVARAVEERSPNDVAIWIDDAHRLTGAPDERLLTDLLDALPANGHLVVVGRTAPQLPVARLAAADGVSTVGVEELRFADHELEALAAAHGVPASSLAHAGGWPAMSRLALVSAEHSRDYVFDEIVGSMSERERIAVAVARLSGGADRALLRRCGADLAPDELVRHVPLLSIVDDLLVAHDLWSDYDVALVEPARLAALVEQIAEELADRRSFDDAIELAIRVEAWPVVMSMVLRLLYDGDGLVRSSHATRWLDALPADVRTSPEARLLGAVHARLDGSVHDGADDIIAAAEGFDRDGNDRGLGACLIEMGTRAWVVGDPSLLEPLLWVVPGLLERGEPKMRALLRHQEASEADLRGEYRAALAAHADGIDAEIILRHRATLHFFCGDRSESVELVDELVRRSPSAFNRRIRATHHFMCGDPSLVLDHRVPGLDVVENSRELPLHHLWESAIAASTGRRPPVEEFDRLPLLRVREQMFRTIARLLDAVVVHDDDEAARVLDEAIDRHGEDDPMLRGELLRFVATVSIASGRARAILDSMAPLSGWNAERAAIAELLLEGRSRGVLAVDRLPPVEHLLTVLPLPWSVEMIALAAVDDVELAGARIDAFARLVGRRVLDELRYLATTERAASDGARRLLAAVPIPPHDRTELFLLGEPRVVTGGRTIPITSQRLLLVLGLLAVADAVPRTELAEAIWPDADDAKRLTSLRVAVKQVRDLLEPERDRGVAPYHLRDRGGALVLADTEHLVVDVREACRLLDEADRTDAGQSADGEPAACRRAAFELIRPGWSAGLDDVADLADALRSLSLRAADAVCLTAERSIAAGAIDDAIDDADRVIAHDPYNERAHAVRIAGLLAAGDLAAAGEAIERCLDALDELGVRAQPGTQMLLRRYERRTGEPPTRLTSA